MGYYVNGTIEVEATLKVRVSVEGYEFEGLCIEKGEDLVSVAQDYLNEHAYVTGEPTEGGYVSKAEFDGEDTGDDTMEGSIVCDFTMEVEVEARATLEGDYKYTCWEDDAVFEINMLGVNDWEIDCEWCVEDIVEVLSHSLTLEGEGEDEEEIYETA